MLIALPLLTLILLFLSLNSYKKFIFREAVVLSVIAWSFIFTISTEILSLLNKIDAPSIIFFWTFANILLLFFVANNKKKLNLTEIKLDNLSKIMLTSIITICTVTLILSILVAPNNIDALTYHLARIPYWIQNKNVNFYSTNITWQIFLAPFASYPKLHFQILSNSDYFANLFQWIFMCSNILIVSLLTKHLGANSKIQIFSAFLASSIPIGIVEASTSQDDHILSFFLISFVYFGLKFKSWKEDKAIILISGISLGLSFLTKQLSYLYAFPFLFYFLWTWTDKNGLKKALYHITALLGISIIPDLGFIIRSYFLFGLPISAIPTSSWDIYINNPVGIMSLISNSIKNLAINLSTPIEYLNQIIYRATIEGLFFLRIDPNNPYFNGQGYHFEIPPFLASEYFAPNTIHTLAILVIIFLCFKKNKGYILTLLLCYLLISSILVWHIANSRYLLTLFLLSCPLISSFFSRYKNIQKLLISLLIINSFYFLFFNSGKPIVGDKNISTYSRNDQYFTNIPIAHDKEISSHYKDLAAIIDERGYKKVGLIFTEEGLPLEYPLVAFIKQKNKNIEVHQIEVSNPTKKFAKKFSPEVVLFISGDKSLIQKYIEANIPVFALQ